MDTGEARETEPTEKQDGDLTDLTVWPLGLPGKYKCHGQRIYLTIKCWVSSGLRELFESLCLGVLVMCSASHWVTLGL